MSDTTSPNQTDALNSFSVTGVLQDVWDTARNTFSQSVSSVGAVLAAKAAEAAARATSKADANRQALFLPTVPVSAGLDNRTMLFLAAATVAAFFILKAK